MTHRRAVATMVLVTLMWSIAGVVSRHLDSAQGFEVTFWRSAFNAAALVVLLPLVLGGQGIRRAFTHGGTALWASGVCWAVMYTAFMLAMTMTSVARVLVVMSIGPLVTALFARLFLRQRIAARTWAAIVAASVGIAWMFGVPLLTGEVQSTARPGENHALGALVALGVPLAAASNWTLLARHAAHERSRGGHGAPVSMLPAVLIGALLSALVTLPMAWPFGATRHDLALLALLGGVQLALPCVLVVGLTRVLPSSQISLLGQLEVIFGVLWAWWGAGERPLASTLQGGALVLAALSLDAWLAGRRAAAAEVRPPRGEGPAP